MLSIVPLTGYLNYTNEDLLSKQEKNALTAMMQIHQSGDTAVSDRIFYTFCDMVNVAGFYSIGGQMYKPDLMTMRTAVTLLNPLLLKELGVDYVLIDIHDTLTPSAIARVQNPQIFTEIRSIHSLNPDWRFYKFINAKQYSQEELTQFANEYKWVLGTKVGEGFGNFRYFILDDRTVYISQTKQALDPLEKRVKDFLLQNKDIPSAMWLSAQAMRSEELYKPQLQFRLVK